MDRGIQGIIAQAHTDAAAFHSEFPGELPTRTDWDSAAWEMLPASMREVRNGWDMYRMTLHEAVAMLNKRDSERARKAGSVTSRAKAKASRENGKKGGRPSKKRHPPPRSKSPDSPRRYNASGGSHGRQETRHQSREGVDPGGRGESRRGLSKVSRVRPLGAEDAGDLQPAQADGLRDGAVWVHADRAALARLPTLWTEVG